MYLYIKPCLSEIKENRRRTYPIKFLRLSRSNGRMVFRLFDRGILSSQPDMDSRESRNLWSKSTWYTSMYVELTHLRVSDALHGRVHVAGVSQVVEPRHALRRRRRREDRRPPPRRRRPRRGRRARRGCGGCKLI